MKKLITISFILFLFAVCASSASATDLFTAARSKIDATTASNGFISITYTGRMDKNLKVQITKDNVTYTYDLRKDGRTERFPLQMGNGQYAVTVLENVSGNDFAIIQSARFNVTLRDALAPYLVRSQIVNYTTSSAAVTAGRSAMGSGTTLDRVDKAYNYVASNMSYDYALAANPPAGYVPNIDSVWNSKKGICYDYSAIMVAILRDQGIPAQLCMGYAYDNIYHAWIEVYIDKAGTVATGSLKFDGKTYVLMDPTFLSTGAKSKDVLTYISTLSNYKKTKSY